MRYVVLWCSDLFIFQYLLFRLSFTAWHILALVIKYTYTYMHTNTHILTVLFVPSFCQSLHDKVCALNCYYDTHTFTQLTNKPVLVSCCVHLFVPRIRFCQPSCAKVGEAFPGEADPHALTGESCHRSGVIWTVESY